MSRSADQCLSTQAIPSSWRFGWLLSEPLVAASQKTSLKDSNRPKVKPVRLHHVRLDRGPKNSPGADVRTYVATLFREKKDAILTNTVDLCIVAHFQRSAKKNSGALAVLDRRDHRMTCFSNSKCLKNTSKRRQRV